MSLEASVWAWKQKTGNPLRKLVLLHMADAVSEHNDWQSWYSLNRIAARCDCSRGAVRAHIKSLVESGHMTMTEPSTRLGQPAKYRLNVGRIYIQDGPSAPRIEGGAGDAPPTLPAEEGGAPDIQGGTGDVPGVVQEMYEGGTGDVPKPVIQPVSIEPVIKPTELATSAEPTLITEKKPEPKSNKTWTAYASAYANRYGAEPVRNQTVNSQLCKFVDRLSAEQAPDVAAYYLTNNKRWYVEKRHSVGTMLQDCEALHNEWITGNRASSAQATQLDRKQSNHDVIQQVIAMRTARGKS